MVLDQLNRLLAAARADTTDLSALVEHAPTSAIRTLLRQIRDDGAWACAGLVGCLARLGRRPTRRKRDLPDKVWALAALPDRIRLVNRRQRWVAGWIDELLAGDVDEDTRAFLVEMRAVNLRNVRRCDDLLIELDRQREVPFDRELPHGLLRAPGGDGAASSGPPPSRWRRARSRIRTRR